MGQRPQILAAIPCHNEAAYVGPVITQVKSLVDQVLVVDDGSTDETAAVARAAGAEVLRHEHNRGYGAAIRSCLEAARTRQVDILVTLDGDGQHDPAALPAVLAPLLAREAELVIGSRFMGLPTNVPAYRKFGIDVITFLFNAGAAQSLTDAQSGLRGYARDFIQAADLTDPGMGASVELLVQARAHGFRIREVPISCHYHADGSSLNPLTHGLGVALQVVRHRLTWRC